MISIVTPAFNAAPYLQETLDSIGAQTLTDWELIVIEDGTDDGTRVLVEAFASTHPQAVTYLRHEKNRGLPATRNTGIAAARGDWVALIDADDLWEPTHLNNLLHLAETRGADIIHSGVVLFVSDTGETLSYREPDDQALADLPFSLFDSRYPIQPSSTLLRTSLLKMTKGFDVSFKYVEDREYWIRLVRNGARIAFCPMRTCRYRQHEQAMTQNAEKMSLGIAMVHDKHGDWDLIPRQLRTRLASEAWLSAGRIVLRGKPRLALKYFARAIHWKKFQLRAYLYWCCAALLGLRPSFAHA